MTELVTHMTTLVAELDPTTTRPTKPLPPSKTKQKTNSGDPGLKPAFVLQTTGTGDPDMKLAPTPRPSPQTMNDTYHLTPTQQQY